MTSKRFTITFDKTLHQKISEYADRNNITVAEAIRQASTQLVTPVTQPGTQSSPPEHLVRHLDSLEDQLRTKDQQFDKLQQALDQEQQLHAVSQKTIESQRLQLDESQRPKPFMARLKAVFVTD
ncbi:MAG: hypothetical protein QGI86_27945 [Candidatus Poribacteria bacterium]|jgi:hypothetical protein|nr:hypothetical protein [Candidatus Poribacteria bacterium]